MLQSLNVIVLSKIRYKESDLIIKAYSQQKGIISFILKGVLKSKKNKKVAYFQLLSQLSIESDFKPNRTLQYIKEVKNTVAYSSLQTNIYKSAIVLFIAEILSIVLKEEEQNDTLFSYLEASLQWLDLNDSFANFHLLFLLNLTKHLGFYPDDANNHFFYFNLVEGKFTITEENHLTISGPDLDVFKLLLGTNFDVLDDIKINAKQRFTFLNHLLRYYELHLLSFKKPKSLQILKDVFN